MPIVAKYRIECDSCGAVEPLGDYTEFDEAYLMKEITHRGWCYIDGKAKCPLCLKKNKVKK
jgi:hypothetical protein